MTPTLSPSDIDAYEHLMIPVWVFSVNSLEILAANRAAAAWLGYDVQTLRSMTAADLHPDSDRARLDDHLQRVGCDVTDAGVWTVVGQAGSHRATALCWRKVIFDGEDAIVASARDEAHTESLRCEIATLRHTLGISAENLSRLFDGLPGKMLVLTPGDYQIVAATDEYTQAVMRDRDALLGRRLFDVFPDDPDDPDADGTRNLRASLQRVETIRVTDTMNLQRYPVRDPDGTFQERFWLPRNKPVRDSDGNVIYIVHQAEDVTDVVAGYGPAEAAVPATIPREARPETEFRAALFALQERETRLKTAETLLELGSWEYDFERGMLNWSERVFDIYGVPRDRGVPRGEDYVALVHPDDKEAMIANFAAFEESGDTDLVFEHRIIREDGTPTHVRGVGTRHRVDSSEIVVGVVQDITPIKTTEEQLRHEARQRRIASRLANLGSWRIDKGAAHIVWGEETAAIHDEPEGTAPAIEDGISYYATEDQDRIRERFTACIGVGEPFDEIAQIVTAKGRRKWVRTIGEPIRGAGGQIVAVEGAFQDITDLIAARDAAAELSARLRRTLDAMNDGFFLLDGDWKFAFLNRKCEDLLQRSRDDLMGRNVWDAFPEAVGSTFQTEYERAVAKGVSVRFREYFAPLDAWFEVDADPTPAGLAVYFRDVTRERARDTQLRLLEAAVSQQNDILLVTEAARIDSPDGPKIIYVNDAFERRTGYSRAEVIGQTPRILQGPKTQRDELDRIRGALEHRQPVRAELINYTKSGEEFWLELDIAPLADDSGRTTHWVAIQRDITARKETEQTLRANEERFRLATKAAGSAIWDLDIATNREWWSEGLRDNFGHEPPPDAATPSIWRAHVHPEDLAGADAALDRLLSGKDTVLHDQYRFRRADGSWALVEDNAFALHDADGNVVRILGSITDITERKQLEDRLHQSQKMEAIGQLTGGVSHDFNNLLTIILGNAEVLEEGLRDDPHLQTIATMVVDAAERGADLTTRLLAFSRKQTLETRVLDVARVIQGMDGMLRRTLPEDIDIEIVRAGNLWMIEADATQLEAAILNTALNARDAMPHGGCLTIEMSNTLLDEDYVAAEPDVAAGDYVVITVTDTGHGISPDLIDRVFEPFFTTKGAGEGSGLGLSMVFGFVKQSGGHIRVYSEMGEGTSFKMYFPRSKGEQPQAVVSHPGRGVSGGTETILVVEDDDAVRDHVTGLLGGLGYRVLEASTGAAAMDVLAKAGEVDLLFTDIVMPGGMGGRELAETARAARPSLKILFTSGYTENAIMHNGRLAHGVKLLSKPYRRDTLAGKVREVLDEPDPQN